MRSVLQWLLHRWPAQPDGYSATHGVRQQQLVKDMGDDAQQGAEKVLITKISDAERLGLSLSASRILK